MNTKSFHVVFIVNTNLLYTPEHKSVQHCIHCEYCFASVSLDLFPSPLPLLFLTLFHFCHHLSIHCISVVYLFLYYHCVYLFPYQPTITSIAPWDFLILLLISFKGPRSMLHGHHTWHRGGPFHGSACSTQFLSQMFCVPGPPSNFPISKAWHALSR